MEKTLTITEAARNFSDVVNRTYYTHESTTLLRSGVPVARIVPVAPSTCRARDFSRYWETISHLTEDEAIDFEKDMSIAKEQLRKPEGLWE